MTQPRKRALIMLALGLLLLTTMSASARQTTFSAATNAAVIQSAQNADTDCETQAQAAPATNVITSYDYPIGAEVGGADISIRNFSAEAGYYTYTLVFTEGLRLQGVMQIINRTLQVVEPGVVLGKRADYHAAYNPPEGETSIIAVFAGEVTGGPFDVTFEAYKVGVAGQPSTLVYTKELQFYSILQEDPRPSCVGWVESGLQIAEGGTDVPTSALLPLGQFGDQTVPFTVELELAGRADGSDYFAQWIYGESMSVGTRIILSFQPSMMNQWKLSISSNDDALPELNEPILCTIVSTTPGVIVKGNKTAVVTILASDIILVYLPQVQR